MHVRFILCNLYVYILVGNLKVRELVKPIKKETNVMPWCPEGTQSMNEYLKVLSTEIYDGVGDGSRNDPIHRQLEEEEFIYHNTFTRDNAVARCIHIYSP